MCRILKYEKSEFLYEDKYMIIVPTKNMKGHKKRVMAISKDHVPNSNDMTMLEEIFKYWCMDYFDEPTFVFCKPTYATFKEHWHRIACDWNGTPKEMQQLYYTPHVAIKTKVKWEP